MSIIEVHLDRPAFKRVEPSPGTGATSEESTESEEVTVKAEPETEGESGGSGILRKALLGLLVAGLAFAAMRLRSGSSEDEAAIDIGTEETRPTTE